MQKPQSNDKGRIQDIPSLRKLKLDAKLAASARLWGLPLRLLLRLLGNKDAALSEALATLPTLAPQAEELVSLPDRFTDLFADRGWIFYDSLSHKLVKEVVRLGERGELAAAEHLLVESYDERTLDFQIMRIQWNMGPERTQLIKTAQGHYLKGEYPACILLVLSQLDGFVNDAHPNGVGFFAGSADLTAFDSSVGHPRGLPHLQRRMQQNRGRTTTEPLDFPYRNGILHGRDLGFGSKLVAAKSWAALFAAGEWVRKARAGELQAPPNKPEPTLRESLRYMMDTHREIEGMKAWRPRSIVVGRDVAARPTPEQCPPLSPERTAVEYLISWKKFRIQQMVATMTLSPDESPGKRALTVKNRYKPVPLAEFRLTAVTDDSFFRSSIAATVTVADRDHDVVMTMSYVDDNGTWILRGLPRGRWVLDNWEELATAVAPMAPDSSDTDMGGCISF
jgi:hypothetical protein